LFSQACNLSKYIPPKKYLLEDVKIVGAPSEEKDQMNTLLKQTPNKKFFFVFKFNMWSYLLLNTEKSREKRQKKIDKLKSELAAKKEELDKTSPTDNKKRQKLENKIVKIENHIDYTENRVENLKKSIWEEPVILDSQLIIASATQLKSYLFVKGYFHDTISYSVKIRGKKAFVTYNVIAGPAHYIHRLDYYIFDKRISDIVSKDTVNRVISPGMKYDEELMDKERNRLAMLLRENGYYNFRREYIYYEIDSSLPGHFVNVGLGIANPTNKSRHRLYKIGDIYVESEYYLNDTLVKDTFLNSGIHYISNSFRIKPSVLSDFIFFRPGELYKANDYQSTINRLSQLNAFKFIDIQYDPDTINRPDTGILTVYIKLTPFKKQILQTDIEFNSTEESQAAITTTRSLGSQADVSYTSRNLGKSALQLEIRPKASIELPIQFLNNISIDTPAYQYGMSASLILPQLLVPWKLTDIAKRRTAQTSFNLNYIEESSKYFKRSTGSINMTWQENLRDNLRLFVTPIEISYVNTSQINSFFKQNVENTHNPLLINLFDQHIITDCRASLLFNQQPLTNVKNRYWYLRLSAETGGNVPALMSVARKKDTGSVTNRIFGVNFYQYSKFEADYRYYIPFLKENNIALRAIAGIGTPNSLVGIFAPNTRSAILPFEKQFYVGGANSIRAWRLRTLGPGSYKDPSTVLNYDKSGDIKLEINGEVRFPIYSILKGALFTDAGNVWLFNDDPKRPGSGFYFNRFYKEFAVGSGIGVRLDFNFFVIRLDFAVPLRDPSEQENHRWQLNQLFSDKDYIPSKLQVNLGIGYPF
jgi:outer membrane protein insertion porin family